MIALRTQRPMPHPDTYLGLQAPSVAALRDPNDTPSASLTADWLATQSDQLAAMLARMGYLHSDAADAAQEAVVVGLQYLRDGMAPTVLNPQTWLRTVAVRAARKAAGRRLACDPIEVEAAAAAPCDEVARRDEAEALLRAISELPQGPRQALVFCALEGHTYGEAARQFGVCAGAVGRRLLAARDTLRDRLRGRGFDPAGWV